MSSDPFLALSALFYTVGLTPADRVSVSQAPSSAWLASGFRRPWWRLEDGRRGEDRVFLPLVWYFQQDLPFLGFYLAPFPQSHDVPGGLTSRVWYHHLLLHPQPWGGSGFLLVLVFGFSHSFL